MSNIENEFEAEQEKVSAVTELIQKRLAALENESSGIKTEIVDIKANFWEDVTVNFEDSAETAETYASMKQQAELLSERERSQRVLQNQVRTLQRLEQSPYFGRIDICEEGGPIDSIYLGVGTLLDENNENYLIYDWRAPISSIYYDFGPGPISYTTPSGIIDGKMTLKRQYIIRYGHLLSMFDTGITIGDEILQEALGHHSDASMKSIVATIQQEQNQIIRNESAKLLFVQGAAGSGKTSAALQRVAYLLYRYREVLSSDQIVLFSPNPMFNSYVSTVLPELGEQNMQQTTYQQYLEYRIGNQFELEDPFSQMEYTLTEYEDAEYPAKIASIRLKASTWFMELIDQYVKDLAVRGMKFKGIVFRGKVLISKHSITKYFYSLDAGISIPNRLKETTDWILKELTRLSKLEQSEAWVDEQIELLDSEDYIDAFQKLKGKNHFNEGSFHDFKSERNYLAAKIVQEQFKKIRKRVKNLKYLDVPAMYLALFKSNLNVQQEIQQWAQICQITLKRLQAGEMPYEDATPYLYLKEKLEGFHTNTTVKYVFIDEGQDYSPFQLYYLKKIFPRSRMTILGDMNQSIFAHSALYERFEPYTGLFPEEEIERIELLRSYRSTREIVEFTSRMIPDGEKIIPFQRHGKEPEYTCVHNSNEYMEKIDEKLHEWLRKGYGSLAIICKTAQASQDMYERIKERWKTLILVDQETATFEKGIMVIPSYLAKGVEFDAVMIHNASASEYYLESERRLFYTACTRAMHELHLFYEGQPSPFLAASIIKK